MKGYETQKMSKRRRLGREVLKMERQGKQGLTKTGKGKKAGGKKSQRFPACGGWGGLETRKWNDNSTARNGRSFFYFRERSIPKKKAKTSSTDWGRKKKRINRRHTMGSHSNGELEKGNSVELVKPRGGCITWKARYSTANERETNNLDNPKTASGEKSEKRRGKNSLRKKGVQ